MEFVLDISAEFGLFCGVLAALWENLHFVGIPAEPHLKKSSARARGAAGPRKLPLRAGFLS